MLEGRRGCCSRLLITVGSRVGKVKSTASDGTGFDPFPSDSSYIISLSTKILSRCSLT